jgi:hypothetical protein
VNEDKSEDLAGRTAVWLDGENASIERIDDVSEFATTLAEFLNMLRQIDPTDGPPAGPHNFFRGGPLKTYDAETRQAIEALGGRIDGDAATAVSNHPDDPDSAASPRFALRRMLAVASVACREPSHLRLRLCRGGRDGRAHQLRPEQNASARRSAQ